MSKCLPRLSWITALVAEPRSARLSSRTCITVRMLISTKRVRWEGRGGEESGPFIVMTSLFIDLHFISLLCFSGEISSRGRRCKSICFLMDCPHVCNMQCLSMLTCFSRAELLHSHVYFPVFILIYFYTWINFCSNNMVKFNQWSYVKMYLFTFVIIILFSLMICIITYIHSSYFFY